MATCIDCSHLIAKATAWPHHALGRLHAPTGAGTAIFSCSVCQTTFTQDVDLVRGEGMSVEHRVFGDLRCASVGEARRVKASAKVVNLQARLTGGRSE